MQRVGLVVFVLVHNLIIFLNKKKIIVGKQVVDGDKRTGERPAITVYNNINMQLS